jgi:D-alanyl-lipoteichoic acid acyltransferase DltB (MBOAT superfamily)
MSLSTWLRDYLYISLGGNRYGAVRTYVNLMLTMLIGGLWHGASWRFVVWGGLHGVYLVFERLLGTVWGGRLIFERAAVRVLLALLTYLCVCVTWVFFRAQNFYSACVMLRTMLTGETRPPLLVGETIGTVVGVTILLLVGQWLLRESSLEHFMGRLPWWLRSLVLAGLLLSLSLASGDERAFIYFQF